MSDKGRESHGTLSVPAVPFSYMLDVERVPEEGLDLSISANPDERRQLAEVDEIPAIARLEAAFHVTRLGQETFNVSGEMRALVTQICVVSLEPFESELVEMIDVDFAADDTHAAASRQNAGNAGGSAADDEDIDEPPDPIIDGKIDLGALAAEFLALGLDPYPRKPGVEFQARAEEGDVEKPPSPFAVLKDIKGLK